MPMRMTRIFIEITMKPNTTTVTRNLLGGFLGGLFGVLVAGYVSSLLAPIGCLIGVLSGYWHDRIFAKCKGAMRLHRMRSRRNKTILGDVAEALKLRRYAVWRFMTRPLPSVSPVLEFAVKATLSPFKFFGWLMSHPVLIARTITVCAQLSVATGFLCATYLLFPSATIEDGTRMIYWIACGIAGVLAMFFRLEVADDAADNSAKAFYTTWNRYSQRNPIVFALNEFKAAIMIQSVIFVLIGIVCCIAVMALVGLFVGFFSSLIVVGIIRGLWTVSSRKEHLLCLGISLIGTVASAIVFNGSLSGSTLWIVALATGLACGVSSEIARRSILWAFAHTPAWKATVPEDGADAVMDLMGWLGKPLLDGLEKVADYTQNTIQNGPTKRISAS